MRQVFTTVLTTLDNQAAGVFRRLFDQCRMDKSVFQCLRNESSARYRGNAHSELNQRIFHVPNNFYSNCTMQADHCLLSD